MHHLKIAIQELYGENPLENENLIRIVSEKHFNRLRSFLSDGSLYTGGNANHEKLMIKPTVLTNITWKDPIMQDEIFGPILSAITLSKRKKRS